jgi:hypothetical protein
MVPKESPRKRNVRKDSTQQPKPKPIEMSLDSSPWPTDRVHLRFSDYHRMPLLGIGATLLGMISQGHLRGISIYV